MARAGGGGQYRKTVIVLCSLNIIVALYVIRHIYASIYNHAQTGFKYTPQQLSQMEKSIGIRKAYRPEELIRLSNVLKEEVTREEMEIELSGRTKQMIAEEILGWLRTLNSATASEQREAVERWRKEKLVALRAGLLNSIISPQEAGMLTKALESKWEVVMEDIGLWMPDADVDAVDNNNEDEQDYATATV